MQVVNKMLSTRGGTVTAGGLTAVVAAACCCSCTWTTTGRASTSSGEPITVLVAKSLIEKGSAGDLVGLKGLFQTSEVPKSQVEDGAVTDPQTLQNKLATTDIYPGQQLTSGDFAAGERSARNPARRQPARDLGAAGRSTRDDRRSPGGRPRRHSRRLQRSAGSEAARPRRS